MQSPDTIKRFQLQIGEAGANLDEIDKKIQQAIEKAQQVGDVDSVMKLAALGSELKALKSSLSTPDNAGDAELEKAAETLGKMNSQMDSIISKNNSTAALISNVSDLITNLTGFINPTNPTDPVNQTDSAEPVDLASQVDPVNAVNQVEPADSTDSAGSSDPANPTQA